MIRSNQIALGLAGLSAVAFSAFALISLTHKAEARPVPLGFETSLEVGELGPLKEFTEIEVAFKNRSSRSVRVLGADGHCGKVVCVKTEAVPMDIPPYSERKLPIRVIFLPFRDKSLLGQPFDEELEVYTDNPGQARITLTFRGTIAPPAGLTASP